MKLSFTYLATKSGSRQARRGINKGKCKTYFSPCGDYLNTNRKRIFKHIGKCGNCSRIMKIGSTTSNLVDQPASFRNVLTNDDRYQPQIDKLTDEMDRLKSEMSKFNFVQNF